MLCCPPTKVLLSLSGGCSAGRARTRESRLTRVGHGDLVDLIGVKPNLALTTFEHGGREALLELEGNHSCSAAPRRKLSIDEPMCREVDIEG